MAKNVLTPKGVAKMIVRGIKANYPMSEDQEEELGRLTNQFEDMAVSREMDGETSIIKSEIELADRDSQFLTDISLCLEAELDELEV